jgi:L-arabinokinase
VGHAVRAGAVLEALAARCRLAVTVVGGRQQRVWPASLAAATIEWTDNPADVGVVQSDDVTVDRSATAVRLEAWLASLRDRTARETGRLAGRFDLVVGDVPPPAFAAAKHARIRSVAIANFSWDWVYRELGFDDAARAAASQYADADLLLRSAPFAPMPAFERVVDVGLIARAPSAARERTRSRLGVTGEDLVLLAFQPSSAPSVELPPPRPGRRWLAPEGWTGPARSDLRVLDDRVPFHDAIGAADLVVGKPGYGLIGDVEASGSRFLYVPRPGFPENAVLEDYLSSRQATRRLEAESLASGDWDAEVSALLDEARAEPASACGAERAAGAIVDLLELDRSAA